MGARVEIAVQRLEQLWGAGQCHRSQTFSDNLPGAGRVEGIETVVLRPGSSPGDLSRADHAARANSGCAGVLMKGRSPDKARRVLVMGLRG